MKSKAPALSAPKIGKGLIKDAGVLLNVRPGRSLKALRPLVLGPSARLRSGTILYAHSSIGARLATGHHVVIREENVLGDDVAIWNNTTIDYACRLGDRVKVHCNCYVAQFSVLEDDVFLAPGVTIANDLFPRAPHAEEALVGAIIRRGAIIGVNSTILPGVEIGAGALIGSGSVVTRDIPAGSIAWGNPAKVYKRRDQARWPKQLRLRTDEALAFYKAHLAGELAYGRDER